MNVLVTGCNGQLGSELRVLSKKYPQHRYFFTDIQQQVEPSYFTLDITDKVAVMRVVSDNQIDVIVNCAAYTNVDKAEEDEQTAFLLNATAVKNLAQAAAQCKAKMIHVSTDYVFNGEAYLPYSEIDIPEPATAYGRTKLAGEKMLRQTLPDAIILRTAWLYSTFGNNFVKTMLRLGKERDSLNVVYDQIGSPTYAADLAAAILAIIESPSWQAGIYHFTNEGVCSWYDFTCEIHRLAHIRCDVQPILSAQYPAKTPRPHYSVLNKAKIKNAYHLSIPHWTNGLERCLQAMNEPLQ